MPVTVFIMIPQKRKYTDLLCDIGELSGLFTDSESLDSFLQRIVEMIAGHMSSNVCSIYLYEENTKELVLAATKGLNAKLIGQVKLKLGEGLTGLSLKERRPISERHASRNPNFKYFPGLGEEEYESFLSVPIIRGAILIGAIVIQNTQKGFFKEEDISILRAITSQLANTIEMTRLILSIENKEKKQTVKQIEALSFIKGKIGSKGFAFAEAVVWDQKLDLRTFLEIPLDKKLTQKDLENAIDESEEQIKGLQKEIEERLADVASLIFTAQILMLKDQAFIGSMTDRIEKGEDVVRAVVGVVREYMKKFFVLENAYLQEKAQDVHDIGKRILNNLTGSSSSHGFIKGKIVVANDLLPSDILKLSSQGIEGVILLSGGVTSHISILAQSLGVPLMIADVPELLNVSKNTKVILDAEQGNIYLNPSEDILNTFKTHIEQRITPLNDADQVHQETVTSDGHRVVVMSNVNLLGDLKDAIRFKTEGVGLYRTEFPFIVRNNFPSEEEQYVIYKKLVDTVKDKQITFRTLDIGGDKVLSYFDHHLKEKNPYLGMRSIRFSLQHKDIFIQQIRAIMRASVGADARIMFPMISSVDEFLEAEQIVLECAKDLKREGQKFLQKPKIGIMIELPSVLEILDDLAKHAAFFSVGTNDFIQYMLGVDRTNEKVASLYLPHHPSVLRAIKKVVSVANANKIDVSICGDMAYQEAYLPFLIGTGVRKISINPTFMPRVQKCVEVIDTKKAEKLVADVLKKSSLKDIEKILGINE